MFFSLFKIHVNISANCCTSTSWHNKVFYKTWKYYNVSLFTFWSKIQRKLRYTRSKLILYVLKYWTHKHCFTCFHRLVNNKTPTTTRMNMYILPVILFIFVSPYFSKSRIVAYQVLSKITSNYFYQIFKCGFRYVVFLSQCTVGFTEPNFFKRCITRFLSQ